MDNMEQRVKALEEKVRILEETLNTIQKMQISEQMQGYIQSKTKTMHMVDLINATTDDNQIDFSMQQTAINEIQEKKKSIDSQITSALKNVGTFSDDFPDDPRYFNYEVESGEYVDSIWNQRTKVPELARFVGKGLRITAYNGFESDRIIIPNKIDGQPVISIGEKAFMNAAISEVILPKSIKAVFNNAFNGCKNLKHIDLPDDVQYLGEYCFNSSGITEFTCPNSLTKIPDGCLCQCNDLKKVNLGNQVRQLGCLAFSNCSKLNNISLPESLNEIKFGCFVGTAITTIIIPSNVENISYESFGDNYTGNSNKVTCVFLGKDTCVEIKHFELFYNVSLIYCLPGSNIQQVAREHSIPMKPLSEFRMEN